MIRLRQDYSATGERKERNACHLVIQSLGQDYSSGDPPAGGYAQKVHPDMSYQSEHAKFAIAN